MSNQRRGFFRDAFAGLRKLVEEVAPELEAAEPSPTFVPPAHTSAPAKVAVGGAKVVRRPPGAVPEAQFLELCTGCGACVTACPESTLSTNDRYPEAHPEVHACVMCRDVPCAAACETGALLPIAPTAIRFGTVRALPRLCLNYSPSGEDEPLRPLQRLVPSTGRVALRRAPPARYRRRPVHRLRPVRRTLCGLSEGAHAVRISTGARPARPPGTGPLGPRSWGRSRRRCARLSSRRRAAATAWRA